MNVVFQIWLNSFKKINLKDLRQCTCVKHIVMTPAEIYWPVNVMTYAGLDVPHGKCVRLIFTCFTCLLINLGNEHSHTLLAILG